MPTVQDEYGNKILVSAIDGRMKSIYLKLSTEQRTRHICDIDKVARQMICRRTRSKHLHNKSQSYGFNYKLLQEALLFDDVILIDELGTWKASRTDILKDGVFLFFLTQGFELQVFYPLSLFTKIENKL